MMNPEPHAMHRWLQQLLGDWTSTSECDPQPGISWMNFPVTSAVTTPAPGAQPITSVALNPELRMSVMASDFFFTTAITKLPKTIGQIR